MGRRRRKHRSQRRLRRPGAQRSAAEEPPDPLGGLKQGYSASLERDTLASPFKARGSVWHLSFPLSQLSTSLVTGAVAKATHAAKFAPKAGISAKWSFTNSDCNLPGCCRACSLSLSRR